MSLPHLVAAVRGCPCVAVALAATLSIGAGSARAEGPAPEPPTPTPTAPLEPAASPPPTAPPPLTPQELEAIEKALGAPSGTPEVSAPVPVPVASGAAPQSMNPDMSLIFDGAAAWFSKDDPQALGDHDPQRTGFTLQQVEMHLAASVDPFFRLDANLVFGEGGVEVEEVYATTMALPAGLQVRAGQLYARFGKRNPTHPHSWSFLDQSLVLGKLFGSEGSRGLGVEVSWLTPLPWYAEVVATAQQATDHKGYFDGTDPGVHSLGDLLYTFALKQFFDLSDDWALQWGLSAQVGPNDSAPGNRTVVYGTDLFLRWKPVGHAGRTSVDLLVEGLVRQREVPGDVLVDGGVLAELRWQIEAEWALAGRYDLATGLAADPDDPAWTAERQRVALAVDFVPSHFSRIRLQGGVDARGWEDAVGGFIMLGLEAGIGAHGSHAY